MCRYYAHTHPCGHTVTVFAAYCASAALIQRPCSGGDIWQSLRVETNCAGCREKSSRMDASDGKKVGVRQAGRK